MRLSKRAESQDKSKLVQTFVDVGPLLTILSRLDHQIIYGRRGTGKTHAITYLAESVGKLATVSFIWTLEQLVQLVEIFGDTQIPVSERATRLLADVLLVFHEGLTDFFATNAEALNLAECAPILNAFATAASEIEPPSGPSHWKLVQMFWRVYQLRRLCLWWMNVMQEGGRRADCPTFGMEGG